MEQLIAKMLEDFETGKINRRQLIQSLAAAASFAGTAARASASSGKGFHAVSVNHISYQVADYARTRDFYADLLGMKVAHDTGKECYLVFGDTHLIPRHGRSAGSTPRIDHVAYTIGDWDRKAVESELKRRGLNPQPDEQTSFHIKDPDGFDLQICSKDMKPE
jgi:catechol 2,3-dioxygenase-like lactoylglutathione lyase family enzyme